MMRTLLTLGLLLTTQHVQANPAVDATKAGLCLEVKIDGRSLPCNSDFRLVDDGKGEVSFVTGYGQGGARTVMALFTNQTPDLENAYGYALRLTAVTLMPADRPDGQRLYKANGLCFMVKPNPVRAGAQAVRQDVVVMCSANLADAAAPVRRIDWKFVF